MSAPTHRDDLRPGGDGHGDVHRDCWDLIPWLVNGRLRDSERASVEAHVAACEECRAEVVAQRALRERMAVEGPVTYSPAASFEKLWSRIEELEREVPAAGHAGQDSAYQDGTHQDGTHQDGAGQDGVDPHPVQHTQARARARAGQSSTLSRWLVAAVVVQSIALSWLVHGVLVDRGDRDWAYRTVTSPATVVPATARLRVIFARDITVSEMQRILSAHGLSIVQAPAASEIFTLVPSDPAVPADTARLVERLRAEPAIRFVELAGNGAFATSAAPADAEPRSRPEIE